MSKTLTIFQGFVALFAFIISILVFFSPIVITLALGNWWLLFLFAVSWIPAIGIIVITSAFLD